MNFLLSQELGNIIMAYLIKQPYADVASLIEGLKSLPTANVVPPTQPVEPVVTATEETTETPATETTEEGK